LKSRETCLSLRIKNYNFEIFRVLSGEWGEEGASDPLRGHYVQVEIAILVISVDLEASEAAGKTVEAGLEGAVGLAAALRLVDARQAHLVQRHQTLAPSLKLPRPRV